ncbi:methylated-DNA--[protein]-cysteine S-methyltransferase [Saccharothrix australiensis]|uniref:Methylated-DNA-[protein]-cysteine S-methyltransferase n=1 Tax=Saccharothrix australiensis TaxID=2072 RepID=A0A495VZJ0_9PSEU|nr:methylated-DNA--[protein]-cysteine S-methyltransferase [Saccharothrix australiensis]RKT54290.1 methylated-DNA-[protein]-cysteine S-methyltransferase [Saccharothrix australiensis]
MTPLGVEVLDTPVGPLVIVSHADGAVAACGFAATADELFDSLRAPRAPTAPRRAPTAALAAARAYFDGELTALDAVEVRQPGTPLTQRVWRRLREQPAGTTTTYRDLLPAAPRVAGRACAVNRVGLFVPCHRVHRRDGGLGGYSWGLAVKQWLRHHEERG